MFVAFVLFIGIVNHKTRRFRQTYRRRLFRFTTFQPSSLSGVRPSCLFLSVVVARLFTTIFQTFLTRMPAGGNH